MYERYSHIALEKKRFFLLVRGVTSDDLVEAPSKQCAGIAPSSRSLPGTYGRTRLSRSPSPVTNQPAELHALKCSPRNKDWPLVTSLILNC